MEFLKELSEAWSQRIRSPFFGSFLASYLILNWKPVWYLLFADKPVRQKFLYFDASTDLWTQVLYPASLALILAIALPWLKFVGAYVAAQPTLLLRNLQHDESQKTRIHKLKNAKDEVQAEAELDAAREQARIDAARRLNEAKEVGGQELADDIEDERNEYSVLNEIDYLLLAALGQQNAGSYNIRPDSNDNMSLYIGEEKLTLSHKDQKYIQEAISNLSNAGLVDIIEREITAAGYA